MTERVVIKVKEIQGNCVVFKGGEKIVIEGPEINLKETDKLCINRRERYDSNNPWHSSGNN